MFGFLEGKQTHNLDGIAQVTVPKKLQAYAQTQRTGQWAAFRFITWDSQWNGTSPSKAKLSVIVLAPEATALDTAIAHEKAWVNESTRLFPGFGPTPAGSRIMHIEQGAYQFGPGQDPHKALYMQMVDQNARAAVVLRAYERVYSIDKARVMLGRILDSLARNETAMQPYFAQLDNWPAEADKRKQALIKSITAQLAPRGFPPPQWDSWTEHSGYIYAWATPLNNGYPGEFCIGRQLGEPQLEAIPYPDKRPISGFRKQGSEWTFWHPSSSAQRPPSQRLFEKLTATFHDPSRWPVFTFLTIEMPGEEWTPDPGVPSLDAFFRQAEQLAAEPWDR